jgi:hypothetical protein
MPDRPSHVEAVLAKTLRVGAGQLPERLRELKATRSYVELAEHLTARGAPVSDSWLHRYLHDHPPA